ncbi:MAG: hypothetical protein K8S62_14770 [Candidatus Sabulitectum sp.]|nr:hypothetical protein [Candidatus Sabulitectum sp.]
MIACTALLLCCIGVIPGPGWSYPILVTDSANTARRIQYLNRDSLGRFHLVWAGYNDDARIGYKMFLLDGTTVFSETMISLDSHSSILSEVVLGDSLIVFWRDYNPIYYAIRSLEDGSEITPATYLFTTSTNYPYIRTSPDSLGRLHVLYNIGKDVIYAVWTPALGSGFITEYEWMIEGADAGGVLLVDGNRVHIVVQDPIAHDYSYLQYDLEGNTVVPLVDFTVGSLSCSRFPELCLDLLGNLMVIEDVSGDYLLWKIDRNTGATLINAKVIVAGESPEMAASTDFIVRKIPDENQYYLTWRYGTAPAVWRIFSFVFDSEGNTLTDWYIAYDYIDEDPEDIRNIDGVVDEEGNLYIVYVQVETEPQIDYFPTFGWFDRSYLGIEDTTDSLPETECITLSQNPVQGGVQFSISTSETVVLKILDLMGREVSSVELSDGSGFWNGTGYSGERLPAGVYTATGSQGISMQFTFLN